MKNELELIYAASLEAGENPLWDSRDGSFHFLDILGQAIYEMRGDSVRKNELNQQIGCLALCENGDLLLGLQDGIYRRDFDGNMTLAHQKMNIKGRRFNDGKVGPDGALYVGTTDYNGKGAFYRLCNGILTELFDECACSNGLDWTRDSKKMYYIDSPKQMIEIFDFDASTGTLSGRRKFVGIPAEFGLPDGMTLDENDNLWVALWNGHRVIHIDKETGAITDEIRVPCPKASSCAFGDKDLSKLYITTAAKDDLSTFTEAGRIYKVDVGVRGKEVNYYKW